MGPLRNFILLLSDYKKAILCFFSPLLKVISLLKKDCFPLKKLSEQTYYLSGGFNFFSPFINEILIFFYVKLILNFRN